ncbi:hypothetical protein A4G29_21370 [Mycobacterium kansasii]|nr:hypothetical protein A4G29_21370 [Mycobacterium kansasii]
MRALSVVAVVAAVAVGLTPAATADSADQLRGLLPAGYRSDSCTPERDHLPPGALAALTCRDNALPGGTEYAYYELYADTATLAAQFLRDVSARHPHPVPCPDRQPSPGPWVYDSAPNTTAGSILCGRVEGGDDVAVEWTKDRDLLLALASGPDLAGLYNWWKANRSTQARVFQVEVANN